MARATAANTARLAERVTPSRGLRRDIQGLRAVAVLMVVAFHAGLPVPGGFVGVDVFFVISGFVITAMLMREWASTGRIRLGRFYIRRFKRLTPALALMVGVVLAASFLLLSPIGSQQTAVQTAAGAMLLAANVVIAKTTGDYFDAPAETNPLLNTWSLSVEEQFYLVFPAALIVGWALGKRAWRPQLAAVAIVAVAGVASFALALAGSQGLEIPGMPGALVGFYSPATRAWEFAAGALLALGGAKVAVSSTRVAFSLLLAGGAMLAASLWVITGSTPFPGVWALLPVIGTLLLIAGGTGGDSVVARALASGPMVAIGDRSYSIYLWHWPVIVFAHLLWPGPRLVPLAAAVLSLIPAYTSYRWVEQPIRSVPHVAGLPLARLVAASLVPPLLVAGALGVAAANGFWNASVQQYQASIQPAHAGAEADCTAGAWRNPAKCTWNRGAPGQPIYLVGDSNADQFSEALITAAGSASRPFTVLAEDGCSYLPPSLARGGRVGAKPCDDYMPKTEALLLKSEAGLVVIANSYIGFRAPAGVAIGAPGASAGPGRSGGLDDLASGLAAAVRSLKEAGHAVILIQAIPHWGEKASLSWAGCSALRIVTVGCSRTMTLRDVRRRQRAAATVVASVAVATGASVLALSEELCPDGTCSSVSTAGMIRYRDGTHITVEQSEALAGTFGMAIAATSPQVAR